MKMVRLNCIEENCSFRTQDLEFDHAEKLLQLHLDRRHPQNGPLPCPMEIDPNNDHKKEAKKPCVLNSKETVLRMSNVPQDVSETDILTFLAKTEWEPRSIHFELERNGMNSFLKYFKFRRCSKSVNLPEFVSKRSPHKY